MFEIATLKVGLFSSFELKIGKKSDLSAKVLSWLSSKSRLTVDILLLHNKKTSIIKLKLELKLRQHF